ncbi:Necrosis and ethylene-inducing protein 6 [Phytophthora nicotianae]|uniref:Necrosis and ethylene-inducing protein 6 n=1 Tax=Phytophthora nicotianae TaxID=4792 RepID=A0A0W8CRQ0_PHYNI|nr:Necrosis and ethylene-inducing protein 6 [Phytophthora nicotianae]
MDKYFGSKSVECVLSDIFWASIKGDIGRMKHLVEVEGESPTDSKLDPWNGAMCPLDWANVRGHTKLLKAIEKVCVSSLPSHDDLR